jgi:hypothetical protein
MKFHGNEKVLDLNASYTTRDNTVFISQYATTFLDVEKLWVKFEL